MTVCIAAIAQGSMIYGATDKMITSGDIEFEPLKSYPGKILAVTNSIAMLTAGDSSLQQQIFQKLAASVEARIKANPKEWVSVTSVADEYVNHYNDIKFRYAAAAVLSPLGLTVPQFISMQQQMATDFIRSITDQMQNYLLPGVETIIAGVDTTPAQMAHIFKIIDDRISCEDGVGFAAIGIGARHAENHFMQARYHRGVTPAESILRVYFAKRLSEIAPGVGKETELFTMGPQLGTLTKLVPPPEGNSQVEAELARIYKEITSEQGKLDAQAVKQMHEFVAKLPQATPQQQTTPPPESESGENSKNT